MGLVDGTRERGEQSAGWGGARGREAGAPIDNGPAFSKALTSFGM